MKKNARNWANSTWSTEYHGQQNIKVITRPKQQYKNKKYIELIHSLIISIWCKCLSGIQVF